MVYTIDGTEPTAESTVYSAPIEFTESGILKIRSVLPSGKMSKTRTITVEKQALAPAKEVAKTTPGLEMQVTDGMFLESSKLADVRLFRLWDMIVDVVCIQTNISIIKSAFEIFIILTV